MSSESTEKPIYESMELCTAAVLLVVVVVLIQEYYILIYSSSGVLLSCVHLFVCLFVCLSYLFQEEPYS